MIANKVYVEECAGSGSSGIPQKRWNNTVKDCLKKRGLGVRQARRMVYGRGCEGGMHRALPGE